MKISDTNKPFKKSIITKHAINFDILMITAITNIEEKPMKLAWIDST
jgi:hypothetical protein